MAGAIVVIAILGLAGLALRKQFRKGAWKKSCPGCAGHCGGSCHCGGAHA